jgi:hypothetical protein
MLHSDRELRHFFVYVWRMLSSLVGAIACMLSRTYEAVTEEGVCYEAGARRTGSGYAST